MSKPNNTQKPQAVQQQDNPQENVQTQGTIDDKAPTAAAATTSKEVEKVKQPEQTTATATDVQKTEVAKTDAPQKEEAKVEEKPVASVAPEAMAKQQAHGAMAIYIDRIKKDGTAGEKLVVETMEAYLSVMGSGKPLDTATIVREQTRLYTMFKNIGRRTDDFRKAVVVARYFFRENANGAFHDTRINRGHESLQMSSDDRRAFYTYLQLFKIIASVNDLKDVKKSVDVSRSLTNPVIPAEVKERYVSLVN